MATAPTYSRVSPGLYRSSTGQLTPQSQIKKPTVGTPVSTATPTQAGQQPADVAAQRRKYQEAVNRRGRFTAGSQEYNNNASIIKDLGSRLGFNWQKQIGADWSPNPTTASTTEAPAPAASEPAPTPTAPASVPVIGSQYANYNSPMTGALLKAMGQGMNTMQAYEPKNFEGSPLYQFQKQKGMQDMEKLMASRGLTGSGAEVQANSDFLVNLNAQESEKQRQYADQAAQRQQQAMQFIANFDQGEKNALRDQWNADLDRQTNIGQFEATRGDRRQEIATNFLQNLLNMQSNSNTRPTRPEK